ncbi:MAG: magnesium transporter [Dehalococcoidia bacterium]
MVQETVLHDEMVERLQSLAAGHDSRTTEQFLSEYLDRYSNRDVAEALIALPDQQLANLVARLEDDTVARLLSELEPIEGASLLLRLTRVRAADVLEEMDPDDAADLVLALGDVDERAAEAILTEMEPLEASDVRELIAYPEDSAGGLMTTRFVTVRPDATAAEALAAVRRLAHEERTETIYYLYVTGTDRMLIGVLSLRELVLAPPGARVGEVMRRSFAAVRPEADQEEAAHLLTERHLLAVPVVDGHGRLLGIVTADDIADVVEEEATEDIQHLGGSQPLEVPYPRASVWLLARKRVGWLLLLFDAEAYTGTVLRAFEDELQAVVALTFFIPLLIGTGGNTGSQVVTTIIRAQALGEVRFSHFARVLWKELRVAMLLASAMFVATYIRAWTLGVEMDVRLTVAASVVLIVVWAATVGAMLPLILRKLRVDPAVVSAPFITTLVDGTGLIIYFEVARRLLSL